jgi:hypothetical protein
MGMTKINCPTNSRVLPPPPPRSKLCRQMPAFRHSIAQASWDVCSCTNPATVLGSAAQTSRRSTKPCACQRSPGRQLFSTFFHAHATKCPHIHRQAVITTSQKDFWCSIPQCRDLQSHGHLALCLASVHGHGHLALFCASGHNLAVQELPS